MFAKWQFTYGVTSGPRDDRGFWEQNFWQLSQCERLTDGVVGADCKKTRGKTVKTESNQDSRQNVVSPFFVSGWPDFAISTFWEHR